MKLRVGRGRGVRGSIGGRIADLVDDVLVELSSRQARALLMVLAVGLSTGALLASVGISTAASRQIGSDIAASTLDLVSVSVGPGGNHVGDGTTGDNEADAEEGNDTAGTGAEISTVLPPDTDERLTGVDLIATGGRRLDVSLVADPVVARLPNEEPQTSDAGAAPDVVAVTPGYLRAARTEAETERLFFLGRTDPVAFLGPDAADKLEVPVTDDLTGLQIWINGTPYDVVGFVGSNGPAALGNAVVIPYQLGLAITGSDNESTVLVRTKPGAGSQVAKIITQVIRPDAPDRLDASPVVSVDSLRRGVSTQMDRLALWTGIILMALTILLIANSMVVAVMARSAEIGLRRALGSSQASVAATFLTEGALIGLLGGLTGAAVGSAAVVATCALNGWTAVLHLGWIATGPAIGLAVGLVASLYPAVRAARVHPAQAVRSE